MATAPISKRPFIACTMAKKPQRSEEHTSELQSPCNIVCRLLLEKKNVSMPGGAALSALGRGGYQRGLSVQGRKVRARHRRGRRGSHRPPARAASRQEYLFDEPRL